TVRIVAGPGTDWFTDPGGRPPSFNAPALAGPQEGRFRLSARVTVAFGSTFDAGGSRGVRRRTVVGQALPGAVAAGRGHGRLGRDAWPVGRLHVRVGRGRLAVASRGSI